MAARACAEIGLPWRRPAAAGTAGRIADEWQLRNWISFQRFSGGPFVESRFFGEGIGIAVRKGNDVLRQALNWALFRVWEKGRYTDLWLRYFSVSPF